MAHIPLLVCLVCSLLVAGKVVQFEVYKKTAAGRCGTPFQTLITHSVTSCAMLCSMKGQCVAFNAGAATVGADGRLCELVALNAPSENSWNPNFSCYVKKSPLGLASPSTALSVPPTTSSSTTKGYYYTSQIPVDGTDAVCAPLGYCGVLGFTTTPQGGVTDMKIGLSQVITRPSIRSASYQDNKEICENDWILVGFAMVPEGQRGVCAELTSQMIDNCEDVPKVANTFSCRDKLLIGIGWDSNQWNALNRRNYSICCSVTELVPL